MNVDIEKLKQENKDLKEKYWHAAWEAQHFKLLVGNLNKKLKDLTDLCNPESPSWKDQK